jgi:hypothetical protein
MTLFFLVDKICFAITTHLCIHKISYVDSALFLCIHKLSYVMKSIVDAVFFVLILLFYIEGIETWVKRVADQEVTHFSYIFL